MIDTVPGETSIEAGTAAERWVGLTYAVLRRDPLHNTISAGRKPVPMMFRVTPGPPATAVVSEFTDEMTGAAALTVRGYGPKSDPAGICTVRLAVPGEAIRLAGTTAVNWFALTNVVAREEPFHSTVEPGTKPLPLTVRGKSGPPAAAEEGLRPEIRVAATIWKVSGLHG